MEFKTCTKWTIPGELEAEVQGQTAFIELAIESCLKIITIYSLCIYIFCLRIMSFSCYTGLHNSLIHFLSLGRIGPYLSFLFEMIAFCNVEVLSCINCCIFMLLGSPVKWIFNDAFWLNTTDLWGSLTWVLEMLLALK